MTTTAPPPQPPPGEDLEALAADYGLTSSTTRDPILTYLREVWVRRDFIVALGSGRKSAQYRDTVLGRLWQVLSPILNAIVYYLIFGVLLETNRGVQNFPAFLIIAGKARPLTAALMTAGAVGFISLITWAMTLRLPEGLIGQALF